MYLTIKHLRMAHDLTQKELANILQVQQSSISRWEKGKSKPSKAAIDLIREKFGNSVSHPLVDSIVLFIKNSDVCLTLMDENLKIKEVSKGLLEKRGYTYKQALTLDLRQYVTSNFKSKFERSIALGLLLKGDFSAEFHIDMKTVEGETIYMNVRLTPIIGLTETPLILSETRDILSQEYSANKFKINHRLPAEFL